MPIRKTWRPETLGNRLRLAPGNPRHGADAEIDLSRTHDLPWPMTGDQQVSRTVVSSCRLAVAKHGFCGRRDFTETLDSNGLVISGARHAEGNESAGRNLRNRAHEAIPPAIRIARFPTVIHDMPVVPCAMTEPGVTKNGHQRVRFATRSRDKYPFIDHAGS